MSDNGWRCPGCGSTQPEPGFLIDQTYGGRGPLHWGSGAPERSIWNGTKQPEQTWNVQVLRCTGCGRLEMYATNPI